MRTTDANQINMALAVQKVIVRNQGIWNNHQGFANEVDAMHDQLRLISRHQQQAEVQLKGVTADKANAEDKVIEMAMGLGGSAYVYAKKINNPMLLKQFKLAKKSLNEVEGVVAISRLNKLHDDMEAIIDQLVNYVTVNELAAFKTAIVAFEERVAAPRDTIVQRGKDNELLATGIKELKSIFENMDNLISKFGGTEFEMEYKRARIVIDLGSRKEKNDGGDGNSDHTGGGFTTDRSAA